MARQRPPHIDLSRRERQIMDVIYTSGKATAVEVHERLPDPPSRTAVRTILRILEAKGHLTHVQEEQRHIYRPTFPRAAAQRSATKHLLQTFFGGSPTAAIATLLDAAEAPLSDAEREELIELIARARRNRK
jgi:BlaI family transcriptional regulator, penicillinase repressor